MYAAQFTQERTVLNALQAIIKASISNFGAYAVVRNIVNQ